MKTILYPEKKLWGSLCNRPVLDSSDLEATVKSILDTVRQDKDLSLAFYSRKFDGVEIENLKVTADELDNSSDQVPEELKKAIDVARSNLQKFHSVQIIQESSVETSKGVVCQRKSVGIEKVGLYIPGGSAPLFSTVLMLGIPAKLAGCKEIILCTPPGKDGKINPVILYTAGLTGITSIFKTGGAQAIAAMAYGTETIPKVYKIFGPGNQFVTKAKELIQQDASAGKAHPVEQAGETAGLEVIGTAPQPVERRRQRQPGADYGELMAMLPGCFQAGQTTKPRKASSTASGCSAISAWPAPSRLTLLTSLIAAASFVAALGWVIMSLLPLMIRAGQASAAAASMPWV